MEISELKDNIFHVKGIVSKDLCRSIVRAYDADENKEPGRTTGLDGNFVVNQKLKVTTDLPVPDWKDLFGPLNDGISSAAIEIAKRVPALRLVPFKMSNYMIQHYKKDEGFFKWHIDSFRPETRDRQMALVLYLNSVDVGGETRFESQKISVKPEEGDAVFFPTFWTHRHCGEVPVSNDKYIVTSFLMFCM